MNESFERDAIDWERAFEDFRLADVANALTRPRKSPPRGASAPRVAAILAVLRSNLRRFRAHGYEPVREATLVDELERTP